MCVFDVLLRQLPREDRTSGWLEVGRRGRKRQDVGERLGLDAGHRGLPGS